MTFTEPRNAVGTRQGTRFNYPLDKLVGHFVAKTEDGYQLRKPGQRVVEAVLSGAMTMDWVRAPDEIDFDCRMCGEPILVSDRLERLDVYRTGCAGRYDRAEKWRYSIFEEPHAWMGGYELTPAGARDRGPMEQLFAASLRSHLENMASAHGLCPRYDGSVERHVTVCDDHAHGGSLCERCRRRHAIQVRMHCISCPYEMDGMAVNVLATDLTLRRFVAEQGIDPVAEGFRWGWDCEEIIRSTDPLDAAFRFELGDETITVAVDDQLNVVDVVDE